jgi:hypothetical protein
MPAQDYYSQMFFIGLKDSSRELLRALKKANVNVSCSHEGALARPRGPREKADMMRLFHECDVTPELRKVVVEYIGPRCCL